MGMKCHQKHENKFHDQQVVWKDHHLKTTENIISFNDHHSHILERTFFCLPQKQLYLAWILSVLQIVWLVKSGPACNSLLIDLLYTQSCNQRQHGFFRSEWMVNSMGREIRDPSTLWCIIWLFRISFTDNFIYKTFIVL